MPSSRFKSILYQKPAIVASIDRDTCTYSELKEILIDTLGSNRTSLGIKLISDFQNATKSMSSLETFVYLKGLTDSISMVTDSKEDVLLFIANVVFRASRPLHQHGVVDSRSWSLSILILSGSLPIYSHTIRLTLYLFSHSCYCLSVFTPNSCSLAHQCIRAHSRAHCLSICILATYIISSPTPKYLVSTIRFATYLALVCCLATARLTTNVLSCLSSIIVLVLTHPHTQTCLPNIALRPRAYLFLHALSGLLPTFSQACCLGIPRLTFYVFSDSRPMYLFIGLLPILSQAHCLCILRLAVYLVSGSLPMYS